MNYRLMNAINWHWNLIHYYVFKWITKVYTLLSFIDPIVWFYKIPKVKKFYLNRGIDDVNSFIKKRIFEDPKDGINSIWAGRFMGGIFVLIEIGFFNFFQGILGKALFQYAWDTDKQVITIPFIIVLLVLPIAFNRFVLFKDDKYIQYFYSIEKSTSDEKKRYELTAIILLILIWSFIIGSFGFLIIRT